MRSNNSDIVLSTNVGVPIRLRRAIHLNDLTLVKRIVKKHGEKIQNPDFDDKGNTTLHLAAALGFLEIAQFLIEAGHEDNTISCNADGDTPLHLAVETSVSVATLLASEFPRCIPWKNKQGADTIMLSARSSPSPSPSIKSTTSPTTAPLPRPQTPSHQRNISNSPPPLLSTLLSLSPLPVPVLLAATDHDGNTALHYASAYGQLKAIRALLVAGANPGARNNYSWSPVAYSSTVQAEVYFKALVGGGGSEGGGGGGPRREGGETGGLVRGGVGAGLRIVKTGEDMTGERREGDGKGRAGSAD